MSEFLGIIERGLQRLNNSHVQDLHLVQAPFKRN
jgi:hypothetical protein